ncbi:MAG: IS66 family transposase zinc-finger binding domain-containing protein [Tannerella sp.]|nr:IS66 family transposase zinc-finger binding domain-containing protein [Tannerella sp.]
MHVEPTAVIRHEPCYCRHCGKDLSGTAPEFAGKRQVIDIPPIEPGIIEHQIYLKRCSCGHTTRSDCPSQAHSSICYGAGIQALTACFHARQYIPFERMEELCRDLFDLSISRERLVILIGKFSEKASGVSVQPIC